MKEQVFISGGPSKSNRLFQRSAFKSPWPVRDLGGRRRQKAVCRLTEAVSVQLNNGRVRPRETPIEEGLHLINHRLTEAVPCRLQPGPSTTPRIDVDEQEWRIKGDRGLRCAGAAASSGRCASATSRTTLRRIDAVNKKVNNLHDVSETRHQDELSCYSCQGERGRGTPLTASASSLRRWTSNTKHWYAAMKAPGPTSKAYFTTDPRPDGVSMPLMFLVCPVDAPLRWLGRAKRLATPPCRRPSC